MVMMLDEMPATLPRTDEELGNESRFSPSLAPGWARSTQSPDTENPDLFPSRTWGETGTALIEAVYDDEDDDDDFFDDDDDDDGEDTFDEFDDFDEDTNQDDDDEDDDDL